MELSDVKWGFYKNYEGPLFHGSKSYILPSNPTPADLTFDVITRTEGGAPDGVNGYDRCIISVGYMQWCEAAYFLTSKLLGYIADHDRDLLHPMNEILKDSNAEFKKNGKGRWRFFFNDARGEVDEKPEQMQLFLLHSNGLRGSWDDDSKHHARRWVKAMADTLIQPEADRLQIEYSSSRMKWFAMPDSRKILWDENKSNDGWVGALRTAFLSFAGNLPAVADKHLKIAISRSNSPKWSSDWCIEILKELTFGPQIAIYPGRYDKIRAPLERNYGIDLPNFSSELKDWEKKFDDQMKPDLGEPKFFNLMQIQQLLTDMGYDLGDSGVDGIMGPKTKDAIEIFQGNSGLMIDGIVGPKTRKAMLEAWRNKICV